MLPLVAVGDEEGFRGAVVLSIQVQLLHLLVGVADADEGAQLRVVLRGAGAVQLLPLALPALAVEVDARRRAEEPLFVAVGLLRDLREEHRVRSE